VANALDEFELRYVGNPLTKTRDDAIEMRETTILNTTARYAAIERVKLRMIEKGFRVETIDRARAAERITRWLS